MSNKKKAEFQCGSKHGDERGYTIKEIEALFFDYLLSSSTCSFPDWLKDLK